MKKKFCCWPRVGWIIFFAGIAIVLAVMLPACFWWAFFGVALVVGGIALIRCK